MVEDFSEHLITSLEQCIKFARDFTTELAEHDRKIRDETAKWARKNEADYWIEAIEAIVPDKLEIIKSFREDIEKAIYKDDPEDD